MDRKTDSYYAQVREDLLPLIPRRAMRLLDVGCGTGETGLAAKQRLGTHEVIGIEFFESVALIAQTKLDQVIVGDIETLDLNFPENYFDCILCAGVATTQTISSGRWYRCREYSKRSLHRAIAEDYL